MAEGAGYDTVGEIRAWISGHEKLCADRAETTKVAIGALAESLRGVASTLRWAAALVLSVVIGVTGWSLKANWDTQQAQLDALRQTRETVTQSSQQVVQQVQQATGAAQIAGQPNPPSSGERRP